MDKLKELQEKRQQLAANIKSFIDEADKKGPWSAEDKANYETLNADYDANKGLLDAETTRIQAEETEREARDARVAEITAHKDFTPKPRARFGRDGGTIDKGPLTPLNAFGDGEYRGTDLTMALQGWLMRGTPHAADVTDQHRQAAANIGMSLDGPIFNFQLNRDWATARASAYRFRNALSGEDGSSGGYTKDQTLINNLELAMLAYGGVMQVAEIIRTATGDLMRWPTANDTTNTGRQVGENASHDAGTDPSFGAVEWNAYTFTSDIVKVPNELMTDSVFNLPTVLGQMLGQRLGRIQNTKYTTGTGAGTAKGITVCAAAGVTAASATAIAFDELIDLEHSLDPSRRAMPGVGYMFHDSILKALRKLKDGEGRYLWMAGANSGAPDTLNTYPYQINQDMASSIAASAITILFGEMPAYKVRQVGNVMLRRLDERFADTNQTGFLAIMRGDGNLLDAGDHPIKKLTQHS
jgi:HK97 family phage major capsid protein